MPSAKRFRRETRRRNEAHTPLPAGTSRCRRAREPARSSAPLRSAWDSRTAAPHRASPRVPGRVPRTGLSPRAEIRRTAIVCNPDSRRARRQLPQSEPSRHARLAPDRMEQQKAGPAGSGVEYGPCPKRDSRRRHGRPSSTNIPPPIPTDRRATGRSRPNTRRAGPCFSQSPVPPGIESS